MKGLVDGALDFNFRLQQVAEQRLVNLPGQLLVDDVGSFVEDVAEDAVVEFLLVVGRFGLLDVGHVEVVELQGTAHVLGDGGRRQDGVLGGELRLHDLQDMRRLLDGLVLPLLHGLSGLERAAADGMGTLDHQLQHETAHLAALAVLGGTIIEDGHVAGPLQQAVEIVGIDGDLVLDGGQFVGLPDAVGNERRVVDAPRNVALVAR